ncbi:hypothetical protein BXZ70DRAFT_931020 [Cristinia sonorae]|uniref:Nucleoside-diphosphate-sugar epimerase n=1 Tax=Cristinia sonorae TaxID=1940300 RepID=A0A8K0URG7_9AGAR|nr:hypothetical protein BXZ70DRAFT_931020 [Cristinia sonorae]
MRLLLSGATGVAGLNIYRAALTDPAIERITLIHRREIPSWAVLPPNAAEKTTTIIHTDFISYSKDLVAQLVQHDACVWALGISSVGMSEADYTRITYEYPIAMVKALAEGGVGKNRPVDKPFRFVYISGNGASTESKQMWAQVKGRAEDEINATCSATPGMQAHNLRPGVFIPSSLYPEDAKHQRSWGENVLGAILVPIMKLGAPNLLITAEQLATSVLAIAKGLYPDERLTSNKQMRIIARKVTA